MFLAPRVAYVGETSLSLGYPQLAALGRMLFHAPAVAYEPGLGGGPGWPLTLASSPGAYLGAAVLLGAWLAFSGRWRSLAWPFVVTGAVVYLASLAVIADAIPDALGRSLIVGLYLHAPYWIGYELVLVLPVLGAIGLASWPEAGSSARRIAVGGSAAVLVILPLLLGVGARTPVVVAVGAAAVVGILWLASSRPRAVWALPFVLVLELGLAQVVSVPDTATTALGPIPVNISPLNHFPLTRPVVLSVSPFQRPLSRPGSGRFILTDTSRAKHDAEPHGTVDGATEPAWLLNWALVSGAHSVQAYRAVVLLRYWKFVRAMGSMPSNYEHIRFADVPPTLANLLQVGWVLRPAQATPGPGEIRVRHTRHFALYQRVPQSPPVSLFSGWTSVGSSAAALARVRNPRFDPTRDAVIEGGPESPTTGQRSSPGTAGYLPGSPGSATVVVNANERALVLIRTPFAEGWEATVDDRGTTVVPADYVDQGVVVPAGRHVIRLTFTDPWVMRGVWGTLVAIGVLLVVALAFRNRRPARHPAELTD